MVFNNTKVIPAELRGCRLPRDQDAPAVDVSLTLLERLHDGSWRALSRPARRLRVGDTIVLHAAETPPTGAISPCPTSPLDKKVTMHRAEIVHTTPALSVTAKGAEGEVTVAAPGGGTVEALMVKHGAMPLPPYIARARPADSCDFNDYQTVYAAHEGAVAAPTAGLHFTPGLMQRIEAMGIRKAFVTLHVGAGTFLPVKAEKVEDHHIHAERCDIGEDAAMAINAARKEGGRIVAVGTTSLRSLETALREDGTIAPYSGLTRLFIRPGHRCRSADLLLTNFHLPKSTLFMLVCAFSGTALMKEAYAHAIASGFRFYSYGDACLLHRTS